MKTYDYEDAAFDYAKKVCKKHGVNVENIIPSLAMYSKGRITDDELLQVLQWIPETPRVTIWKWYKIAYKE